MPTTEVYRYSESSPYRTEYPRPNADMVVNMNHRDKVMPYRPVARRHSTAPTKDSACIVEVEETESPPARQKSIKTILKSTTKSSTTTASGIGNSVTKDTLSTTTDTLATKSYLTSSKTGTLYFAYGTDISPSHLRSNSNLSCSSSSQPVALARLRGWQWMVSSRGVPNIVELCEPGLYNDSGCLRSREKECDASVVYGLIYKLDGDDEHTVDKRHGYEEHGPINTNLDLTIVSKQPYFQGLNTVNKRYERAEVVEWFSDPLKEGVNVLKDTMNIKCLVYVDESIRGLRPGRIWDDETNRLSVSVTTAIKDYGIPRIWVENVMNQYGVRVQRSSAQHSKSRSRSRTRVERETRLDVVKHRSKDPEKHNHSLYDEDDKGSFVETRITKRITEGYEPLPASEFYREKRRRPMRYRTI